MLKAIGRVLRLFQVEQHVTPDMICLGKIGRQSHGALGVRERFDLSLQCPQCHGAVDEGPSVIGIETDGLIQTGQRFLFASQRQKGIASVRQSSL